VFDEHPFKVILDYGHNPAAIEAMCRLVEQLDPPGKRICVVTLPGDRRDEDIAEAGRIVAGTFDHYICRRDDNLRGRGGDEVPKLMKAALLAEGVKEEAISVIPQEEIAVAAALEIAEAGDLLLIFGDDVSRCWKQIIYFNRPPEDRVEPAEELSAPSAITEESVSDPLAAAKPVPDAPEIPEPAMEGGWRLVREERGVRLASEPEEAD